VKCKKLTSFCPKQRQASVHLTNTPYLLILNLVLCYNWLCIKLIGVI
jgi:hypothetical protein